MTNILGTNLSERLDGNNLANVIDALFGDDTIFAVASNNSLDSSDGKNLIYGHDGYERTTKMINKYEPQIPSIVEQLQQSGEDFELLTIQDTEANTEWLENNFPIASAGRIDWQKVPQSSCINYSEDNELLSAFEKIVSEQQLGGNLIISWSNGLTLPIRIDMNVLKKYAKKIFEEDWETWICNEQDEWLIENHHDGEICFGKCRTANEKK